jgi:hypothetical protein
MKLAMFNTDGRYVGECEIPDDIIAAAAKVERYLRTNNFGRIQGLRLDYLQGVWQGYQK